MIYASYPVALGIGGVGRNIYQRTPLGRGSASSFADQKVAEALARSAEGKTFKASPEAAQALINNAGNRAATRLGKLPQGTPLAVAGGESTLDLLDIAAISAGATKEAVKDKQHILTGKEAEFNRKKYKDDPDALMILDSKARELGLIK